MKKLILLALAAMLTAGLAFAKTSPAFSGSFTYYISTDFDNKIVSSDATQYAGIRLNGVIDDWSRVSASLSASSLLPIPASGVYHTNFLAPGSPLLATHALTITKGFPVTLNSFYLTTNITGAFGVSRQAPVGLSMSLGYVHHKPANYSGVSGYRDPLGNAGYSEGLGLSGYRDFSILKASDSSYVGSTNDYPGMLINLSIIHKVNIVFSIFPTTYFAANGYAVPGLTDQTFLKKDPTQTYTPVNKDIPVYSIEVQALNLVPGLSFNVYYVHDMFDFATNTYSSSGNNLTRWWFNHRAVDEVGLTLGYSGIPGVPGLKLGTGFNYDLSAKNGRAGISSQYAMDLFNVGLNIGLGILNNKIIKYPSININTTFHAVKNMLDIYLGATFFDTISVVGSLYPDPLYNNVPTLDFDTLLAQLDNNLVDAIGIDAGVALYLGAVSYRLGYNYHTAVFKSPNPSYDRLGIGDGLYFLVGARF